jgi:UDP-2-acetamido-2,6-beta-L-arabino-hexul-4-ose reductase
LSEAREPTGPREPEIAVLEDRHGDERGASFSLSPRHLKLLGKPGDLHLASIRPGHIRGNHFHALRHELILVIHEDVWSFHWDTGAETKISCRLLRGAGAVAIAVPPLAAHAIRNDGQSDLWLVAATDGPYDPSRPDAYRRIVASGGG